MEHVPVPQADDLHDVVRTVEAVERGFTTFQGIAQYLGKVERQGRYYRKAAMDIGLLELTSTNHVTLTPLGSELVATPSDKRSAFLARVLATNPAFIPVFQLMASQGDAGISREDIHQVLLGLGLSSSTAQRRVATIVSWLKALEMIEESERRIKPKWIPRAGTIMYPSKRQRLRTVGDVPEFESYEVDQAPEPTSVALDDRVVHALIRLADIERANSKHEDLVRDLAARVVEIGSEPKSNRYVDLYAHVRGYDYLFEAKSCHERNLVRQIRRGIAQLYEYRYLQGLSRQKTRLVLALDFALVGRWGWYESFLKDIDVAVCWRVDGQWHFQRHWLEWLSWLSLSRPVEF